MTCDRNGPSFVYHIVRGNAPDIYILLWTLGAVSLLVAAFVIIPHATALRRKGIQLRDRNGDMFVAEAFNMGFWICLYPLVTAVFKFLCLLVPAWVYQLEVLSIVYEALSIFWYVEFLIYLMGGPKKGAFIDNLHSKPPTKYMSAFPVACCLRPLEDASYLSQRNFYFLYAMILQFVVLNPFFNFLIAMREERGGRGADDNVHIARVLELLSLCIGVYGMFAFMRATANVLSMHKIRGKFFAIQSLFLMDNFPKLVMIFFGIGDRIGDKDSRYTDTVMRYAYASTITICWCAVSSFFFKRFYTLSDCRSAQDSFEKGSMQLRHTRSMDSRFDITSISDDPYIQAEIHRRTQRVSDGDADPFQQRTAKGSLDQSLL